MLFRTFSPQLEDMIHCNVVPTIFYNDHIFLGLCKIVRPTFQCIIVLQLHGEGPENLSKISLIFPLLFRSFSLRFENNDTLKCSSDNFENCGHYGKLSELHSMYHCPPIAGKKGPKYHLKFLDS